MGWYILASFAPEVINHPFSQTNCNLGWHPNALKKTPTSFLFSILIPVIWLPPSSNPQISEIDQSHPTHLFENSSSIIAELAQFPKFKGKKWQFGWISFCVLGFGQLGCWVRPDCICKTKPQKQIYSYSWYGWRDLAGEMGHREFVGLKGGVRRDGVIRVRWWDVTQWAAVKEKHCIWKVLWIFPSSLCMVMKMTAHQQSVSPSVIDISIPTGVVSFNHIWWMSFVVF